MDRTPAADRPNRIPSLNTVQWDNKKMVVGAALAGAIAFGVLSLVSGSGSDNKALEARKAPPPAAEAPYDPNSVIAPTLAPAPPDPPPPLQPTPHPVARQTAQPAPRVPPTLHPRG